MHVVAMFYLVMARYLMAIAGSWLMDAWKYYGKRIVQVYREFYLGS
jgi:hypothetical protein